MRYKYTNFISDLDQFIDQFRYYDPDIILSIARGGATLGHFIANRLKIRDLYSINSIHYNDKHKLTKVKVKNIPNLGKNRRVLIVDDIIDSGDSMYEILKILKKEYPANNYKVATLFYKKDAKIKPDFMLHEAKDWIDFFWELD